MPHANPLYPIQQIGYIPSISNKVISAVDQLLDKKNKYSQLNDIFDIEQDYIDLFSYKRKGHMTKYIHMYRPDIYDTVIQQDSFYPFKMECDLLAQKADQIVRNLKDVAQALEIGPGSYSPIMHKSVPFLKALGDVCSFSTYKAMDSNLKYARQASQIIQKHFPTIKTEAIEIDFLSISNFENIKVCSKIMGRKLLFSFGQSIFANNDEKDVSKFLKSIENLLNEKDYFLFSVDENKDEDMIERAYNTKFSHELLLNIMFYLKNKINIKDFNPEAFEPVYKWNPEKYTVEHYLKPTTKQTLKIMGQEFVMDKNNEFNILNSRKVEINKVEKFLNKEKIRIKEIFSFQNNKISIVVAQKTNN